MASWEPAATRWVQLLAGFGGVTAHLHKSQFTGVDFNPPVVWRNSYVTAQSPAALTAGVTAPFQWLLSALYQPDK